MVFGHLIFQKESVGKPFNGVEIAVQDKQLIIKSDTIMKCYAMENTEGTISTSDLGELSDGYVYLNGRADNLIISGGENIDPTEAIIILKNYLNLTKSNRLRKMICIVRN